MENINTGDTAFMLISAALVMFMTPGLALFYGGMVRAKNILGTIMQSFFSIALISIIWMLIGYTLAFGPDKAGLIGGLDWIGLRGVGQLPNPVYGATIPALVFMIYQGMFAVITPALISGAFAERMKFSAYAVFIATWSVIVYSPIAHWVWGSGGWLRELGVLDFAGGTVVHISAGIAALAGALVIGKRKGLGTPSLQPHNLAMVFLGTAILWFGWFGFNAGSAIASGGLAASAFVVTHIAACTGVLGWMLVERLATGKATMLGAASGAIAGLGTITPASGFVSPTSALIIGFIAGVVCYYAVSMKWRFGYDDSLDVVGVHCVGGTIGTLAAGLLAQKAVNAAGSNGLLFGNPKQFAIQAIAVAVTLIYSFTLSYLILKVIDVTIGLRVTDEEEEEGLDLSQHGEAGYA